MKQLIYSILIMSLAILSCNGETEEETANIEATKEVSAAFDKARWHTEKNGEYPYREEMVDAVVYSDTIRSLHREEILDLMGEPDRENEGHLYYLISETKLFAWPLATKYIVIKTEDSGEVEWIRIHD